MRRIVSALAVALLVVAAVVFTGAKGSETPKGTTYKIVFDNVFGLTEGGDFRVGGVKAGVTPSFDVTRKNEPPKAVVTAKINQPGFAGFHKNATCDIRPQSLIGEYYVDCQPGSASAPRLKAGATIPVTQTTSTVGIDTVNDIMRQPYRERLRSIVTELGTGLAGRPKDLAAVIRRAHPGLRETQKTLRILGNQNQTITQFIADSDDVVTQLEARKQEVTRFIREAGDTAEITDTRRRELEASIRRLPGFLDELTPTMRRLGDFTDETTPLLSDAQQAAPSLTTFLTRVGPFANAAKPAVRALGSASQQGTAAFNEGRQEVAELKRLGDATPGAAKPLAQFLNSLDDRRRAIDSDPRGKVGAPPASDVSNRGQANNGGFTGFESIWSYFFWQTMSLNGVDNLGHVLRVGLELSDCAPLQTDTLQHTPSLKGQFDKCNGWLGPNQPGNTTPDFTQGATAASSSSRAGQPATAAGERRSAGQPDAGPVKGQRDISKPQVTLPPTVQQLLDQVNKLPAAQKKKVDPKKLDELVKDTTSGVPAKPLTPLTPTVPEPATPQAPSIPGVGDGVQQLLDYLMAP